mmetsp:Transcript_73804/g.163152  ORF Transcript_73804/g.163152 Transcript_73804/m.163152 type:complete len:282 (-) Transcript_73804:87-932(-)
MSGTPQNKHVAMTTKRACHTHTHPQAMMLLQMHHHVERDPVQHVSILETCPLDKFQSSLTDMIENKLFLESNITNSAQTRYLELAEVQQCELGPEWWVSQKPLVINVGEGTTATTWLHEDMKDLGFNSKHGQFLAHAMPGIVGTSQVDMFDYITDTPTSSLTWQLLRSHPKALFLMTMRDPVEWRDSRIKDHIGEPDLTQGLPCGVASLLDANNPAAETYVAYSAWAKCVIPEDRFLAAVNVFADENNDAEFVKKLIQQLEAHGLQKSDWENRTARVMATL